MIKSRLWFLLFVILFSCKGKPSQTSSPFRQLTAKETSALGVKIPKSTYPKKIDGTLGIIEETVKAFEVNLDGQNPLEVVIYRRALWGFPNDKDPPTPAMTDVWMGIYKREGKKFTLSYAMPDDRLGQYLHRRFEIEDIDRNGFPEILLWSFSQGLFGGQRLDIYEWDQSKKNFSSTSIQSVYLKLADINDDGKKEIESGNFLNNSFEEAPSTADMVLWSDFYSYSSGSLVEANKNHLDYFRQLQNKSIQRLQSIKNDKADPWVLKYKGYYERADQEIIDRCRATLD